MTETKHMQPLADLNARWATEREIHQQPAKWRELAEDRNGQLAATRDWLHQRQPRRIWLAGAGTSAFVGDIVAAALGREHVTALPTTDIVSSPEMLLSMPPDLLVSFGRSGSSSETVATLDLFDRLAPRSGWLNITCNPDSALAHRKGAAEDETRSVVMPDGCNDAGFAMTSSFSAMTLAALALLGDDELNSAAPRMRRLADLAQNILARWPALANRVDVPSRVVFIGSGALKGAAREAALKVLELTAGAVPTQWDSSLGFRHGPKAVIDERTVVFVMPSSDRLRRAYDLDLAAEIRRQFGEDRVIVLSSTPGFDMEVTGDDGWDSVLYVLWAQLLAVHWSRSLGLDVDNPFASGNLTRVVASVKIHPVDSAPAPRLMAGIDVGGTKIASGLFNHADQEIAGRRRDTPRGSYDDVVAAIADEVEWLKAQAQGPISVGIGLPGLVDPETGIALTSNLALSGRALRADLRQRLGIAVAIENDCKCFALSEARRGAGQGHRTVFGLILGTGVGGGLSIGGALASGAQGLPGEVGHIGIPAAVLAHSSLPTLTCGCGREGCFETYLSGPGLSRLHQHRSGQRLETRELAAAIAAGDAMANASLETWCAILAELLVTLQLTVDPDIVVIGGGLSNLPGLVARTTPLLAQRVLSATRPPKLAIARFGADSGVRGAAFLGADLMMREALR